MVADLFELRGLRQQLVQVSTPASGILVGSKLPDPRPIKHGLDPLPHARCSFGLCSPDRLQYAQDQGGVDLLNWQITEHRLDVRRHRAAPLLVMLLVAPTNLMRRD